MFRLNPSKPANPFFFTVLIGLTAAALLRPCPAQADAGLDAYNFARGLYKAERWLQAEEAFRQFQAKFPKHEQIPFGKLYLGLSQIQLEKHSAGRDTLEVFIKDYP
ncbi:MAG: tetratricopeptide repeat protein, partial [Planctomycetaceae bacterium]|nr:tetratricopeptide repeat protein [Planctomycetaceae bacterium]